jgi:hypothetical protein
MGLTDRSALYPLRTEHLVEIETPLCRDTRLARQFGGRLFEGRILMPQKIVTDIRQLII